MPKRQTLLARISVVLLFGASLFASPRWAMADDQAKLEFFEKKIRPVLVEHCYRCHAGDEKTPKGGLRVDSRQGLMTGGDSGAAIEPGNAEESLLLQAIRYDGFEMPPKGKLPDAVARDFEVWIKNGAVDPRSGPAAAKPAAIDYAEASQFWAFQPPADAKPPQVKATEWVRNDIDRFILARLEAQGLSPSDLASRETQLRRAYFDLIGLPPTPEEVAAFLQDKSPNAFAKVVDRLLDSPHYGERWGRRWLDVARYGEDQAHTFKARRYPRGYLYRDWVVRALNDDMPYDRFLTWQIAGDLLDEPNRHERLAALGLFALGPVYYAENVEKAKAAADEWDDRIDTLTRGVLGLTVACARCHDHKFDPITTKDYYALAGVFASTNYQERPVVPEQVVASRRAADENVKQHQLQIDRFLLERSREVRPKLAAEIPEYFQAAWRLMVVRARKENEKKELKKIASKAKLSSVLVKRWADFLAKPKRFDPAEMAALSAWSEFLDSHNPADESADSDEVLDALRSAAEAFQSLATAKLPRRESLFAQYGENAAFAKQEDLADVPPGVIPLGNLFDDSASVSLDAAIKTDRFSAEASADKLGVDRVSQGFGEETRIAPDVQFHFGKLGATSASYGSIVNDGWQKGSGLRTRGKRGSSNRRQEQGVGMHANALVTFDLDEIRRAGLLASDQKFRFRVDRAGINDDTLGSNASAYLIVLVTRPHRDKTVTDAVLAAYVNGKPVDVDVNDFTYYVAGELGPPITANGKFVNFDIAVPADAKHLTLVTTGAGGPEDNPISSDHAVFSGARLELDPLPKPQVAEAAEKPAPGDAEQDRADAVLLSRLLYDEGLLAIPANETEAKLDDAAKAQVADLRKGLKELQAAAKRIEVLQAHSLTEGSTRDLPVYLQGNPARKGEVAERAMPAIFTAGSRSPFASQGSGRLELAKAIASPQNPLTARVMVNRVWAGHFGVGLVKTTSNLGQLGDRPSHPDLLDWLALDFIQHGWSLKHLHRRIMLSSAYQQSSGHRDDAYAKDPENRLLWRMNRRRLEVEPWRDGLLSVSGELDDSVGGPSQNLDDANNRRRTLYGFVSRHRLNELLRLFDFPDPNITAADRPVTTVPLQQLFVLNSDFMTRRAKAFARRLEEDKTKDDEGRVRFAYQLALGRKATDDEVSMATEFLALDADKSDKLSLWEQFSLALLSSNETMFVD